MWELFAHPASRSAQSLERRDIDPDQGHPVCAAGPESGLRADVRQIGGAGWEIGPRGRPTVPGWGGGEGCGADPLSLGGVGQRAVGQIHCPWVGWGRGRWGRSTVPGWGGGEGRGADPVSHGEAGERGAGQTHCTEVDRLSLGGVRDRAVGQTHCPRVEPLALGVWV